MRSYLIDEISQSDIEKIYDFMKRTAVRSGLEKIFWVQIPEDLLSETQLRHRGCQPYVFAIEIGTDWVRLEFFVRNLKNFRCTCGGYCTPEQGDFILGFAHNMIDELGIET